MLLAKKSLIAAAAVAALSAGAFGITTTFAQEQTASGNEPFSGLIEAIAEKFNVPVSDVEAVFEEEREKMQAERAEEETARLAEMLSTAVEEGKLTEDQAQAIQTKADELRSAREDLADATDEERKAAMEENITALKEWAEENNIPEAYLHVFMMGGGHGPGGPGRGGMGFGGGPGFGKPGEEAPEAGTEQASE